MLDVQLYGMDAGRHHLTNVIFHIASAVLLFLTFYRMTGALWRSAFLASLFAFHPINVESVAWIAARKNVLSTFFWMLGLFSYAYYVEKPDFTRYLAVLIVLMLGLLVKPMLITLPFVFLLLDYWPLGRLKHRGETPIQNIRSQNTESSNLKWSIFFRLILEKIPLLAVALASVCLSLFSLHSYGSVKNLNDVSMLLRIENAFVSSIKYIVKMIWPAKLAIFYPYPGTVPLWHTLCAVVLLICLTILIIWVFREKPYLGVGWLWYLGTFIPVSGLVQSGVWPALADRWAYVPFIGLFMMIAWGIPYPMQHRGRYKAGLAALLLAILSAATICTWNQVKYWKNSVTLFQHALTVNPENWLAHCNLGDAFATKGNLVEASQHFAQALRLNPNEEHVQVNYGYALLMQGRTNQAASHFREALRVNPGFAEAHNNLGLYLIRNGELEQSTRHFQLALRNRPNYLNAARNLKLALFINDKINTATKRFKDSLVFSLQDPELDQKIDTIIKRKYELIQAIALYQKSLSRQPGFVKMDINKITAVTHTKWQYENNLPVFKKIIELQPENAGIYYNIACIYGGQGKDKESLNWLNQALQKGFDKWDIIKTDFDLENIRKFSNYKQLAKDS